MRILVDWHQYFHHCRCDSIEKLRSKLPSLESDLRDLTKFKDLYQFTFNFAKNPGQKSLGKKDNIYGNFELLYSSIFRLVVLFEGHIQAKVSF